MGQTQFFHSSESHGFSGKKPYNLPMRCRIIVGIPDQCVQGSCGKEEPKYGQQTETPPQQP
jgi:hypothetical protein